MNEKLYKITMNQVIKTWAKRNRCESRDNQRLLMVIHSDEFCTAEKFKFF
jgi:hypothetical protein